MGLRVWDSGLGFARNVSLVVVLRRAVDPAVQPLVGLLELLRQRGSTENGSALIVLGVEFSARACVCVCTYVCIYIYICSHHPPPPMTYREAVSE